MGGGYIGGDLGEGNYSTNFGKTWCVDYTTGLTGRVGMIIIAGERGKGVNIQPGYQDGAVYDAIRDGELQSVPRTGGAQPPTGNYWNWSMRPGWQKWRPNYRYGKISYINYSTDRCNVTLYPLYSIDQPDGERLSINQGLGLVGVPITYMDCDSEAFLVGDIVVVKFSDYDWNSPFVIGFKSHPIPCIGYWEPFETDICGEDHLWIYSSSFDQYECPITTPIEETYWGGYTLLDWEDAQTGEDLVESSVILEAKGATPVNASLVASLTWVADSEDEDNLPIPIRRGLLRIKLITSMTGTQYKYCDAVRLVIYGDNIFTNPLQNYMRLYFESNIEDRPNEFSWNVPSGDGEEQEIDLTQFGLSVSEGSEITYVQLYAGSCWETPSAGISMMQVNYLIFV